MPRPKERSTSVKKKKIGKKIKYSRKETPKQSCAVCKTSIKLSRTSEKQKKNPLCTKCSKMVSKYAARIKEKKMSLDDVDISYAKFVSMRIKK